VTATGHGNIGDQAMLDAIVGRLSQREIILVSEDTGALEKVDGHCRTESIPGLLNGTGLRRFRAHQRYATLARRADEVIVIGADLMDGLYNPRKSVARLSLLRTAVDCGALARVTGFSWPPQPSRAVVGPARQLSNEVTFLLRDPASFERFTKIGGARATLTADVVFTDLRREPLPADLAGWVEQTQQHGRPFAVVNVSGLIEKRMAQVDEYREVVEELRRRGHSIAFLPHVVREKDGDSAICRRLFADLGTAEDVLISEALSPAQVRALTGASSVVVTGRMHLAIMSLSQGTPAITLATQGKVEGLYSMFGLEAFAIEPSPGFGARVIARLDDALSPTTRGQILERLPGVRSTAEVNFEGLHV
jgi:polysaccharide pyruvyl transferase WcaK-like protein